MHRAVQALLHPCLLLAPLLLAACSSSPEGPSEPELPALVDFRAGACRTAAPDLLTLGRTLPRLGDEPTVEADVQDVLREVQDGLVAVVPAAEPQYAGPLQELVETLGGVRIRAVGNTYDPLLGDNLATAYQRAVEVCTGAE